MWKSARSMNKKIYIATESLTPQRGINLEYISK